MIDPTMFPVRFSRLKHFALSPAHYLSSLSSGYDSKSMRVGRGVHLVRSGAPLTVYDGERRGKAWKAFEAEHAGEDIVTAKERDLITAVARAIESDPVVVREKLLDRPGSYVEHEIAWEMCGRACQSTPDQFDHAVLLDVKTTRCAKPDWFMREAMRMSYPGQLAFYGDAIAHRFGFRPRRAYLIAVETKPPFPVVVLKVSSDLLERASRINRIWFEELLNCERSGHFPGYTQNVVDFDVPEMERDEDDEDDEGGDELIVGGERISL